MAGRAVALWLQLAVVTMWACSKPKAPPDASKHDRATLAVPPTAPSAASMLPVAANEVATLRDELLALPKDRDGDRGAAKALHRRAMTEHGRKDFAAAERTWAEAARADPSWDWPFYNLACVTARTGRPDDAMAYLEAVRTRNPAADMIRRIAADHDLDALRKRPEFTAFLASLTQQVAKAARVGAEEIGANVPGKGEVAKEVNTPLVETPLPVPEALQKRIRHQLREVSPAPLALRETVLIPLKGGGAEVVGFYEFSAYEDCVQRSGGSRKEARERCLPALEQIAMDMYDERDVKRVRLNRHCKRYGLFYAKVAAAPQLEKGSLKIEHKRLGDEDCDLIKLKDLRLDDIDLDGRRELVLDMVFGEEARGDTRSGDDLIDKATMRYVWVLEVEPAWRVQLELPIGVRRVGADADARWVDLNRDKRPDLVQVVDCDGRGGAGGYNEECDEPLRERIWYLYDRELDTWRDPDARSGEETKATEPKAAASEPSDSGDGATPDRAALPVGPTPESVTAPDAGRLP